MNRNARPNNNQLIIGIRQYPVINTYNQMSFLNVLHIVGSQGVVQNKCHLQPPIVYGLLIWDS